VDLIVPCSFFWVLGSSVVKLEDGERENRRKTSERKLEGSDQA
jgi:hypothetical protein